MSGESRNLSVLFVCTGNTCRSPLAESLCRKMIADRLGCETHELDSYGIVLRSAGVAAFGGDDASPEAVDIARTYGADLSNHQSRPVNPELLDEATHVVVVTRTHAAILAARFPGIGPEPILLAPSGEDLADPIGGGLEVYQACAETIRASLQERLDEWFGPENRETTES